MERDKFWATKRSVLIYALRDYLSERGAGDWKRKTVMGIYTYLQGDKQAEDEFYEALSNGAQLVIIPLKIGETGNYRLQCCGLKWLEAQRMNWPQPDDIELTVFSHQVWTCPRCGKVYALFNEAADGGCDEQL